MPKNSEIKKIIDETVNAAFLAGRTQAESTAKNTFKATERRLYALPVLQRKIKNDKELLEEYETHGTHERSKSFVRFQRTGYRASPEQMLDAVISDLKATIATDENEIATVRRALEAFKDDPYYATVTGRYIDRYDEQDIADDLECSTVTVWKQRLRIVKDIAVLLYGAIAI